MLVPGAAQQIGGHHGCLVLSSDGVKQVAARKLCNLHHAGLELQTSGPSHLFASADG